MGKMICFGGRYQWESKCKICRKDKDYMFAIFNKNFTLEPIHYEPVCLDCLIDLKNERIKKDIENDKINAALMKKHKKEK